MNEKVDKLYETLDKSINEFGDRVLQSSKQAIERDMRTLERRMEDIDARIRKLASRPPQAERPPTAPPKKPSPAPVSVLPFDPSDFIGMSKDKKPSPAPVSLLPPLPKNLTVSSLENYFRAQKMKVLNNRPMDGGFWVLHNEADFSGYAELLSKAGIRFKYYPKGRSRVSGPQYELDTLKRLPL